MLGYGEGKSIIVVCSQFTVHWTVWYGFMVLLCIILRRPGIYGKDALRDLR